jgi:hypothetical protein
MCKEKPPRNWHKEEAISMYWKNWRTGTQKDSCIEMRQKKIVAAGFQNVANMPKNGTCHVLVFTYCVLEV